MGVRNTLNTFQVDSDEIIRSVSKLYFAKQNQYALISMLHANGLEFEKTPESVNVSGKPISVGIVTNPKFEQHLDELESDEVTINNAGGYSSSATSIVVSDGTLVPKYAMLYVPSTGEYMRVSSVSGNTLTVTRGEGGTTAAAIENGAQVLIHGSAYAEGSASGDIRFGSSSFPYNYTQIFREPYGKTRTAEATKFYNNVNSYDVLKRKALASMLRRVNGTMWLGGRSLNSSGQYRTMGGILEFVDSGNVMDVDTNLTRPDWETFLRKYAFAYNSNEKTLFAGSQLIDKIDGWLDDKALITNAGIGSSMGVAVRKYQTRYGILNIVWEPYFDKVSVGTHPLNSYGVVLDLDLIKFNYLSNGILRAKEEIQDNDEDLKKGEWLMEGGIEVNVAKAHAIIRI